jgi:hypothetical protein
MNNQELSKIFREDQKDRIETDQTKKTWMAWVKKRDKDRKQKVLSLIKNRKITTAEDLFRAAMIFHHSDSLVDIKKAQQLAKKSMSLEHKKGRWLYAAAIDRLMIMKGKPQKFGTQYKMKKGKGKTYYELFPIDPKTKDSDRIKFRIKPLDKIPKIIK